MVAELYAYHGRQNVREEVKGLGVRKNGMGGLEGLDGLDGEKGFAIQRFECWLRAELEYTNAV